MVEIIGQPGNYSQLTNVNILENLIIQGNLRLDGTENTLKLNVLTEEERDSLVGPEQGDFIFNSDADQTEYFNGAIWDSGVAGGDVISAGGLVDGSISFFDGITGLVINGDEFFTRDSAGRIVIKQSSLNDSAILAFDNSEGTEIGLIGLNQDGTLNPPIILSTTGGLEIFSGDIFSILAEKTTIGTTVTDNPSLELVNQAANTGGFYISDGDPTGSLAPEAGGYQAFDITNFEAHLSTGTGVNDWKKFLFDDDAGGSDTQVQFNNSGAFDGDAKHTWIDANARLVVGDGTGTSTTAGVIMVDRAGGNPAGSAFPTNRSGVQIRGTDAIAADFIADCISDTPFASANLQLRRARETGDLVVDGDTLGGILFDGNDGTGFITGARIRAVIDGTAAENDMPTELVFELVPDGSDSLITRFSIKEDGDLVAGKLSWDNTNNQLFAGDYSASSTAGIAVRKSGSGDIPSDVAFYAQGTSGDGVALRLAMATDDNAVTPQVQFSRKASGGDLGTAGQVLGALKFFTGNGFGDNNYMRAVTISAAGTGYVIGEVLTVVGGTGTAATMTVTAVSGGFVTGVEMTTAGSYIADPPNPASTTGGGNDDATFNFLMIGGEDGEKRTANIQASLSADEFISPTSLPTRLEFFTTPEGSTSLVERMVIAPDGSVNLGSKFLYDTTSSHLNIGDGSGTEATAGTILVYRAGVVPPGETLPDPATAFHAQGDLNVSAHIYLDRVSNDANDDPELRFRSAHVGGGQVTQGDILGTITFQGHDSASYKDMAEIRAAVDGSGATTGSGPGRLEFLTTPLGTTSLVEAMRITREQRVGIGTISPNSLLQVDGSFAVRRVASGAADVNTADEVIIAVTDTAAARVVTIQSADIVEGRLFIIKDESGGAGANNITIATQSTQLIDGASDATIATNFGALRLYANGTNLFSW